MPTPERRCISGAAMYLSSQAGKSGERTLRYSRASGVRWRRQRLLQVVISSMRLSRLNKEGLMRVGLMTSPSVRVLTVGFAVIVLISVLAVLTAGMALRVDSGVSSSLLIGRVAFLPVGRR